MGWNNRRSLNQAGTSISEYLFALSFVSLALFTVLGSVGENLQQKVTEVQIALSDTTAALGGGSNGTGEISCSRPLNEFGECDGESGPIVSKENPDINSNPPAGTDNPTNVPPEP